MNCSLCHIAGRCCRLQSCNSPGPTDTDLEKLQILQDEEAVLQIFYEAKIMFPARGEAVVMVVVRSFSEPGL